jgi:O-methyltransferase involved in polyketide biosynthesis
MKPDQLSNTAAFIGVKFYGLTRDTPYRSLFDEDVIQFYEKLVQQLPAPLHFYHKGLRIKALRRFFTFWEELLLPGDLMHILLRKWYLSRWVDELIERGYKQVLVLGAGFDHLAPLNASNKLRCIEIDVPEMIRLKQKFLKTNGYDHPNLLLQPAYFPDDALQTILKSKMDPDQRTIVVAEGFFDYFTETVSSQLLHDLASFFQVPLQLLSTTFALDELSGFRGSVYRNSVKLAGEELKLSLNFQDYCKLLERHEFSIQTVIDKKKMKSEVLEPQEIEYPVLDGFYLVRATINDSKN